MGQCISVGRALWIRSLACVALFVSIARHAGAADADHKSHVVAPIVVPLAAWDHGGQSIVSGQRIELDATGRVFVAKSLFPAGGEPHGLRLPPHLGGGYLFFQAIQGAGETHTAFWLARSWTGDLEPVARLPLFVEQVEPGFDRLYLVGRGDVLAFDLETRKVVGLGPLPTVSTIDVLSFADDGRAALATPLRGVLSSSDGGLTWRPLEDAVGLEPAAGIVVMTRAGKMRLLADGRRVPFLPTRASSTKPRAAWGKQARKALLSGVSADGSVWAVDGSTLLELRTSSPRVPSEILPGAEPNADGLPSGRAIELLATSLSEDHGECLGVRHAPQPWFVCTKRATDVLELRSGALHRVLQLQGRRAFKAAGPAGVLFEGACSGGAGLCWVTVQGAQTLPASPAASAWGVGKKQVVALIRGKRHLELVGLSPRGPVSRFALPAEGELARLFEEGTWLPELVETSNGFAGWLTRGEEFVGVTFATAGVVSPGPIQRQLRRAVFGGLRALVWGAAGFAKETTNGGATWRELALPFRSGDTELSAVGEGDDELVMGCGDAGCSLGRLLRVGWGGEENGPLAEPPLVSVPPRGSGRFQLRCRDAGHASLASPAKAAARAGFVELNLDALEEMGRFAAQGPQDVSWAREGRAQIVFRDPFSSVGLKRSLETQGLFRDALSAEEALGRLEPGTSTAAIYLTADGQAGLFVVSGRSRVDMFAFAAGQPIERVEGARDLGARRLLGVVRAGGVFFTAFRSRDTFHVLRVEANRLVEVASFPLGTRTVGQIDLVQGPADELGIAIDGESGLFIYPLDRQGHLGQVIVAPHQGARPKTCEADAPGYVITREWTIAPYVERDGAMLDVARVAARYRVGPGWSCIDALSGRTRTAWRAPGASPQPTDPHDAAAAKSGRTLAQAPRPVSPLANDRGGAPAPHAGLPVPLSIADFSGSGRLENLTCY